MTDKRGVYWSVMHRRPQDYEYFSRLQPTVFKIMDGGPNDYAWAQANLANSLIVARDWAMSEQHDDMRRDPVGTGKRHAQEWDRHQERLGFNPDMAMVLGINEPQVWEPGVPEALRLYTIAMCDEAARLGLHVGSMQLSVGWPGNNGPDTPPDWSPFYGVEDAILRGQHALVGHEYFADLGPEENWGWWCGRLLKCPWRVPIIVGESGFDMAVKKAGLKHAERGWRGYISPEQYAVWRSFYVAKMSLDPRFVGDALFASDYANNEWWSFDVEPAYQAILATPIPDVKPDTKSFEVKLPLITNVGKAAWVNAPAGARVRSFPIDGQTVTIVPYGDSVDVIGHEYAGDGFRWAKVHYGGKNGYIRSDLLDSNKLEPQTDLAPLGDNWQRSYPEVLKIEGGLSLDPNDPGNWYNGQLVGTNHGISGAVWGGQYDIRNLTKEQALEIYRKHYWEASGADKLPWPMCLLVFDTAVNHGVGVANQLLSYEPTPEEIYLGQRALRYFDDPNWRSYGEAWGVRVNNLHEIVKDQN